MSINSYIYIHMCLLLTMKFKSKIHSAKKDSNSIKTTIPQAIAGILELEVGDLIEWQTTTINKKMVAIIRKI